MKRGRSLTICLLIALLIESFAIVAPPQPAKAAELTDKTAIAAAMKKVNDYWITAHPTPEGNEWARAVYFTGNMAHYVASGDVRYRDHAQRWAEQHAWQLNGGCNTVYADNQAAAQTYLDFYELVTDTQRINCVTQSIQQSMTWAWFEIDLGSLQSISQVRIHPLDERAYRYYVQIKNAPDDAYRTIINRSANTQGSAPIEDNITPQQARFVRVWFIGAYGYVENWVSINEVEVFGPAAPTTNLALSQTVTCSSQPEAENPCGQLIDGDPNKRWSASFPVERTEGSMNWWWIDALYMAMPVYARLANLFNDPTYNEVMYARYHDTKVERKLYDADEGLWYRDATYLYPAAKTPSGNKIFWSRGNGWVFAAHARMLEVLTASDPHRAEYEQTFRAMAATLKNRQRPEGYWNASLADPAHFPGPESSGTAFFTYGLAWGITRGILPRAEYEATVAKAWNWLVSTAVHEDGLFGYVQPVGGEPAAAAYNDSGDYGVGAFLLAGRELFNLAPTIDPIYQNFLPLIANRSSRYGQETVLFNLESPCQVSMFVGAANNRTTGVGPSCTLTDTIQFDNDGAVRFTGQGSIVLDLAGLKHSNGLLSTQPTEFYRIEAVLEDAGQTDVTAGISLFDSLWEAPGANGVQGVSIGMKDAQHTFWYSSTQLMPIADTLITNTTGLDQASQDFLTKFDLGKRQRPMTGTQEVAIDYYVTPNGAYPVINGVNWGAFPTLKAGSFTYTRTNELRYVVLGKWDQAATPVRFKRLRIVQLDHQVESIDEVNAHFIKRAVDHGLPAIAISPNECSVNNGGQNSSNALWQALLYRGYDYYHGGNRQAEVQGLINTYLNQQKICIDQALAAYASAKVEVYDCKKTPNDQPDTIFWVNHNYISRMHWETRIMYALSGYATPEQLTQFRTLMSPLIDTSMQYIRADGTFPAAGDCYVDDTFAEEVSWLLMLYSGYYALFPTDQPRAEQLLDHLKFLGFIHLSDGRTLNEVYPTLSLTYLGSEYRNFRSRYTYVQNHDMGATDGYVDNHGFHPSLNYAIGVVGAASVAQNLMERQGITTTQLPTIASNVGVIYRDSVTGYLNQNTFRHGRFIANPRLAWCYENGATQTDRYQYNADGTVIDLFNGCSAPSGVEDWGNTFINIYNVSAIYDDTDNMLTYARNVYYNYYAGMGEIFCNAFAGRCSVNTNIYVYMLDAMAFAKTSSFRP